MMNSCDDPRLLSEYASNGSDEAFSHLVRRHVNMVYASALRRTGDPHLAEEIVQATFIILAKKAAAWKAGTILPAWLHRTAQFVAADALKLKRRRLKHEQIAARMEPSTAETNWQDVAPLLDDLLVQLREADRTAIILRFFENKSLREVGQALGWSEDTAQKRVARALDKLRAAFARHGILASSAGLAGLLATHGVQAAPATVMDSVSALATTLDSRVAGSLTDIVAETLAAMFWSRIKTTAAVTTTWALILTAAVSASTLACTATHPRSHDHHGARPDLDPHATQHPVEPSPGTAAVNRCLNNLRQIRGAKEQWALEHRQSRDAVPTDADLFGAGGYLSEKPKCPLQGSYTLGALAENPRCSIPEHVFPPVAQ